MLLRRVIDLSIVFIGVFIAIQVSNWNETRIATGKAEVLTEGLLADLRQEAWIYDYFIAYSEDVLANADNALRGLSGDAEISNEEFLISAYRASQYTWWNQRRSAYDDLVSTGGLDLIDDARIRKTARMVYGSALPGDVATRGAHSPYREAFRMAVTTNLHRALGDACGDSDSKMGDYASLDGLLTYDCALDLPQSELDAAALALKENAMLVPALRLRIATLETQLADLRETREAKALFEELNLPVAP